MSLFTLGGNLGAAFAAEAKFPLDCASSRVYRFLAVNFDPYNILAGIIFGTIGLGAFSYGKKLELWQPITIGLCLMIYPYLFSNVWLLWGIGVGLLVALWFYHDE
jgi:hypothetical protein